MTDQFLKEREKYRSDFREKIIELSRIEDVNERILRTNAHLKYLTGLIILDDYHTHGPNADVEAIFYGDTKGQILGFLGEYMVNGDSTEAEINAAFLLKEMTNNSMQYYRDQIEDAIEQRRFEIFGDIET